jgi:predicted anti-sigma-YlaC factor YlaD
MSDSVCEPWREALAMHLLGDQPVEEMTGLLAHLDGCVECQAIASELTETVAMLKYVDRSSIEPTASVPPDLTARVLGDLHTAGVAKRRRQHTKVAVTGLVGALAAALILVAVFSGSSVSPPPSERALALQGAPSVTATALLVKQQWGTSLQLHERGLPGGQVYTVSMETKTGRWWTAGTYRSVTGKSVSATMACAVALGKITGVRVVNSKGVTVLASPTNGSSPTYN